MISGVMITSFVVIVVVIALSVIVTIKAYSVTYKEKVDPLPAQKSEKDQIDRQNVDEE